MHLLSHIARIEYLLIMPDARGLPQPSKYRSNRPMNARLLPAIKRNKKKLLRIEGEKTKTMSMSNNFIFRTHQDTYTSCCLARLFERKSFFTQPRRRLLGRPTCTHLRRRLPVLRFSVRRCGRVCGGGVLPEAAWLGRTLR